MVIEIENARVVCSRTMQIINNCVECRTETDFVTTSEAARIIQTVAPTIHRLIKSDVLHAQTATNGETYVCLASLEAFEENRFH